MNENYSQLISIPICAATEASSGLDVIAGKGERAFAAIRSPPIA